MSNPGVRNVLPPGQSGTITAADAAVVAATDPQNRRAVDGENAPPSFADQLEMYDGLTHADLADLSDGDRSRYYKDAPLTLSDADAVRSAFYAPEVAEAQVVATANRFGDEGRRLLAVLNAHVAGINAAQEHLCPGVVTGPECPAEYAALGRAPELWTRGDILYVASLVGGIFGGR